MSSSAPSATPEGIRSTGGPRVAVVGAGPCGLAGLKALLAEGLEAVAFEQAGGIGGNWRFSPEPGHSSVYETTHIISSRKHSSFEDFPMPDDYPDFPSHRQMLAYFEAYAERFGLLPHIRLNTRVVAAERGADGRWAVTSEGAGERRTETFDHLLVASGHHSDPRMPDYPGAFSGETLHSHAYKSAAPFRGKRVLVVGGGNSACDIAVETSRVASRTAISMRRGYPIVPKLLFGKPADTQLYRLRHLPRFLRRPAAQLMLRIAIGRYERYGLQRPKTRALEAHPTLNSDLLNALRHGIVHPRPGIARLDGESIVFEDGRREAFDVLVYATGYRISVPFLSAAHADFDRADPPPLYLKMIPGAVDRLYFLGLFQPIGCIWNLADLQARIAAAEIAGRLPRRPDLGKRIAREVARPHWRFDRSARHAIEVDFHEFREELRRELRRAKAA